MRLLDVFLLALIVLLAIEFFSVHGRIDKAVDHIDKLDEATEKLSRK